MSGELMTLEQAVDSESRTTAVGAPWLIAFAGSVTVVAVLSYILDVRVVALATLFQSGVALPIAFALERRMGTGTLAWLHQTRVYIVLAVALSIGAWLLAAVFADAPHRAVLVWWAACYATAAVVLTREHRRRVARTAVV